MYGSNGHKALDDILHDALNQPDIENLKSPRDPEDYVSFTRLVLFNVIFLESVGVGEPGVEAVRAIPDRKRELISRGSWMNVSSTISLG